MAEYQSNSHRSREMAAEERTKKEKMEKVVNGKVKTKKNDGRRLMNMFISEDAVNVKEYVLMDIIVPAISNTILDIIKNSAEMVFGGHSSSRGRSNSPKVSYRRYYDERNDRDRGRYDRGRDRDRESGRFNYDDLVYDNRGDAEVVRTLMLEALDEYGMVTVADMYDMSGLTAPWTASNYGWMGLRDIKVIRVRDGFILNLPKAMPID